MLIDFFDQFLRFGSIANLLWCIVFICIYSYKMIHRPILIALCVSTICHLIIVGFDENDLFGPFLGAITEFFGRIIVVMIWLFCLSLFQDNFRMKALHTFVLGLYIVRSILFQLDIIPSEVYGAISIALRVIIYTYLIYIVVSEYSGDLLEKRRIFRLWFIFTLILVPFVMTFERIFISSALYMDRISLVESLPAFLCSCIFVLELIRARAGTFFSDLGISEKNYALNKTLDKENPLGEDESKLTLLERKMQDGLYREQGLTVSRLAEVINIPEYRLRKLINQYLGHQNISQYLNDYRIAEAKTRLADASQRHISILEIAMDIGYISIRPFNRAFKNRTGQTPSRYRKDCISEPSEPVGVAESVNN